MRFAKVIGRYARWLHEDPDNGLRRGCRKIHDDPEIVERRRGRDRLGQATQC